jgi:hypothetical protein
MFHSSCSTTLDEDVWAEIQVSSFFFHIFLLNLLDILTISLQKFRQAVVKMFSDADQDVVVFENAVYLKSHPHMYIECVPMPKETGELAPIYFKVSSFTYPLLLGTNSFKQV